MAGEESEDPVVDEKYPVRRLLEVIGDKWTPVVIYCLASGKKRFGELNRTIPDISKKMLTQVLRSLERDDLVRRKVYPVAPPMTDYELTELGRKFHEPIALICRWAVEHPSELRKIEASRIQSRSRDPDS